MVGDREALSVHGARLCATVLVVAVFAAIVWWAVGGPPEPEAPGRSMSDGAVGQASATAPDGVAAAIDRRDVSVPAGDDEFVARIAARLRGTVTRGEGGAPLAGLVLHAFRGREVDSTTTDADGRYAFELAAGRWTLGAAPADAAPFCHELELSAGEERRFDRSVEPARELRVRVWAWRRDLSTPLAGAEVAVVEGRTDALDHTEWCERLGVRSAFADAEGVARAPSASRTPHLLFVRAPDFVPQVVELDFSPLSSDSPFGEDGCVHVVLEPRGAVLRGRAADPAGEPLEGAVVFLSAPAAARAAGVPRARGPMHAPFATTDARGEFALELPSPEIPRTRVEWVLLPGRTDLVHHLARRMRVEDLAAPSFVEVRVPRGRLQVIEFVDAEGEPVDGVASVREPDGRAHAPTDRVRPADLTTGGAGRRFPTTGGRITLVHPGGPVSVGLSPGGRWDPREHSIELPFRDAGEPTRVVVTAR